MAKPAQGGGLVDGASLSTPQRSCQAVGLKARPGLLSKDFSVMKHGRDYGTSRAAKPDILLQCGIAIADRQAHSELESKVPVCRRTSCVLAAFF
jgi:hypothetical protein